jgi:hypothetical protein
MVEFRDDATERQIDVYSGRGILSQSTNGPVWLIGTGAEHHVLYQYNIANSKNVYAGLIQTETVSSSDFSLKVKVLIFMLLAILPTRPSSSFAIQHQHSVR